MVTSSSIKKINIPRIWNLKSIQSMNFHCNRHRISTLLKVVFFLVVKLYGFGLMRGKKLRHHKVEFSMDSIVGGSAQLLSHLFYALDPSETRCSVDSLWDRQ